jgi:hypothetical protein
VGAFFAGVELDGKQRLGAVQGLDLGFLVQAEHDRLAGWVQIQPDDVGDLVGEPRILTEFEGALPVRFEAMLAPQVRDPVTRDRVLLVRVT